MRRLIISFMMVLAMSVLLVGCGGSTAPSTESPVTVPEVVKEQVQPVVPEVVKQQGQPIVNINDIANKTQDEVAVILGKADSSYKFQYIGKTISVPNCYDNFYMGGDVEVLFIENKAGRITIKPSEKVPFSNSGDGVLPLLGLEATAATSNHPDVYVRWENTLGIFEIEAFNDSGNISYIYVITSSKYE